MDKEWLDRNDLAYGLHDVDAFNRDIKIVVNGPEEPEQLGELREELKSAFPQLDEAIMRINIARAVPISEERSDG